MSDFFLTPQIQSESASKGLGSSPTLVYYTTTTRFAPQNTRASFPWRTERYNNILYLCTFGTITNTKSCEMNEYMRFCPDCGVSGQRPARFKKVHLLAGAAGLHQGHQHPPELPSHQHPAGPPDLQGPEGPNRHTQGEPCMEVQSGCVAPSSLSDLMKHRWYCIFLIFFLTVLLQHQRHQRRWTLCLPRPRPGVWRGTHPGQNTQVTL